MISSSARTCRSEREVGALHACREGLEDAAGLGHVDGAKPSVLGAGCRGKKSVEIVEGIGGFHALFRRARSSEIFAEGNASFPFLNRESWAG
jgi:hypothetical protein